MHRITDHLGERRHHSEDVLAKEDRFDFFEGGNIFG